MDRRKFLRIISALAAGRSVPAQAVPTSGHDQVVELADLMTPEGGRTAVIRVIALGNCGRLDSLVREGRDSAGYGGGGNCKIEYWAIGAERDVLDRCLATEKVLIEPSRARPEDVGRTVQGADLLVMLITPEEDWVGKLIPHLAAKARMAGCPTVVLTSPADCTPDTETAWQASSRAVDVVITLPNPVSAEVGHPQASLWRPDDMAFQVVMCLVELSSNAGMIGVDFEDVCQLLTNAGPSTVGCGLAKGPGRAAAAAVQAVRDSNQARREESGGSPHAQPRALLVSIRTDTFDLDDFYEVATSVADGLGEDIPIVFADMFDAAMDGALCVTVIACGSMRS